MSMLAAGIYEIRNVANGDRYIGSSLRVARRLWDHRYYLRHGTHRNTHLQNAWRKYGEGAFLMRPLVFVDPVNLLMFEQMAIDGLRPRYNKSSSAVANRGRPMSEETRRRLIEANTGRPCSPETRKKIGDANRGRVHSKEQNRLHAEAVKGHLPWNKGRTGVYSSATLAKMGEGNHRVGPANGFFGKHHSEEHRARISRALKGRKLSSETRARIGAGHRGLKYNVRPRVQTSSLLKGKPWSEARRAAQERRITCHSSGSEE